MTKQRPPVKASRFNVLGLPCRFRSDIASLFLRTALWRNYSYDVGIMVSVCALVMDELEPQRDRTSGARCAVRCLVKKCPFCYYVHTLAGFFWRPGKRLKGIAEMAKDEKDPGKRNPDGMTDEERKTLEELEREAQLLADEGYDIQVEEGTDASLAQGVQVVDALDQKKDTPGGLSESIMRKYVERGQGLIRDTGSQTLDPSTRRRVAPILGGDPGDVRIHTGEKAQQVADALGARAFALGSSDVYFGKGEYTPNTAEGLGVLVHELTHTMDNQVGAALSSNVDGAESSEAEARAEAKEAEAMRSAREGAEEAESAGAESVDHGRLAKAVVDEMNRADAKIGRRSGRSGL